MIYDSIDNFIRHVPTFLPEAKELAPLLEAVRRYPFGEIKKMGMPTFDLRFGEYYTKPSGGALFEAHKKLWDFQLVLEGTEHIAYAPLERLKEAIPYDEESDIAFYSGTGETLTIGNGMAMLLAPWDAHCPGLSIADSPSYIRKIVVKLAW